MKRHLTYLLCVLMLVGFGACSTTKNTRLTRFHHQLNTRYNVYFNGMNSYREGLKKIDEANKDDFSKVIPMYAISNHENAQAASSQMTTCIEKCRKSIKLHSIKKKPKYNSKGRNEDTYRKWYNQEEFNEALDEAWILLGMAEFHQGEFLGAVSTFNYVARHYSDDEEVLAQCRLWSARAYSELGWYYDAEQVLSQVKQDDLNRKGSTFYAAVMADLMLKQDRYREAMPFLKIAIDGERSSRQRSRLWFIMGQLQARLGDKQQAIEAYRQCVKQNTTVDMDFNARISLYSLSATDKDMKSLQKMTRQYKHKEHLDQVFGAMGDICLSRRDTLQALHYYQMAIDTMHNAATKSMGSLQVKAGDLYYDRRQYDKAQPCYASAANIVSNEDPDYQRISRRAESLSRLVAEQARVALQDSLQYLASLSEDEQVAVLQKMIDARIRAEVRAAEQARIDSINDANGVNNGLTKPQDARTF